MNKQDASARYAHHEDFPQNRLADRIPTWTRNIGTTNVRKNIDMPNR
ncbi:MAG: hypothetical protein ABF408_05225 [Bifidobacterium aquikefiri]